MSRFTGTIAEPGHKLVQFVRELRPLLRILVEQRTEFIVVNALSCFVISFFGVSARRSEIAKGFNQFVLSVRHNRETLPAP